MTPAVQSAPAGSHDATTAASGHAMKRPAQAALRARPIGSPLILRIKMAIGIAVHVALLHIVYAFFISPALGYQGFHWHPAPIPWLLGTAACAIAPVAWMPLAFTRPSQIIFYFIYTCVFVPACTIPVVANEIAPRDLVAINAVLLFCMYGMSRVLSSPMIDLPRFSLAPADFSLLLYTLAYGGSALLIWNFGLRINFLSFDAVYDVRFAMRDAMTGSQRIFAYLWPWEAHVILPALFVLGYRQRKWIVCISAIALEVYIYCFTGMKGVLFYLPVVFLVVWAVRRLRSPLGLWMTWGPPVATGSLLLIDIMRQSNLFSILFIRRQFILPGWMLGVWYEYFVNEPKALLGHSILRDFVNTPYSMSPGRVIGIEQLASEEMNACASFWADGYANFGMVGIVMASVIVACVLHAFDSLTRRSDLTLAVAVITIPGLALADSSVLTNLVTHGAGVALIIGMMAPEVRSTRRAISTAAIGCPPRRRAMPHG